jgi:ABC-type nitrate/sulfonate/bicarbonate transport system ATPase subunit
VLLLDEPISALDAFIRMQLQEVLLEIHQKSAATMILVTHDIDEALYLCDRILVLRGQPGRLVKDIKIVESRLRHRGNPSLARLKENILELLDLTVHHDFDDNHLIGGSGI